MVKVLMHPISLIVFLLFEVLMGAETAEILPKTKNELAISEDINDKTIQSDPKTLTNKSPPGEAAKKPLEVSLLAAMASENMKQDKPGASEVDPKLAKVVDEMKENLNYVKSENPEVPENATKSFVPVETESLPSLGKDHFVEKVAISQVQKEKGVNSKKKMEEVAVDSAATLDSGPFTTDKHSTSKSEVTTGQHSTTELEIEAAKTMISKSKTTKASPGAITGKIPTEGKGKMISSKLPRVETSIEGKNPQEACQKDRKMVKFESSPHNSAFRSINNPLEYVILNLVMVVMLLQLLNGLF